MSDNFLGNNKLIKKYIDKNNSYLPYSQWHAPLHKIVPPAIVWGASAGFGWGVIRYLTLGQPRWEESIAIAVPSIIICLGIFYLKAYWKGER